jgi:outer membrane protein assembly factor BamB
MRRTSAAAIIAAISFNSSELHAGDDDLIEPDVLAPAGLVKYWQCPIPLRPAETILSISLENESIYALTDCGAVYAIDADVGLVRWSAVVTEPPFRLFRPCHAQTQDPKAATWVYIASPTQLRIYHRWTGRLLGEIRLRFTPSGPPYSDGQFVYIGSVNNRYYCLRLVPEGIAILEPKKRGLQWHAVVVLQDGKRLSTNAESLAKAREWQEEWIERLGGLQTEHMSAMTRWQIDTEGTVVGRPPVVNGIAYIPSDGGKLFACSLKGKRKMWEARATGGIFADPLIGKGMVIYASVDRSVYAVARLDGSRVWQCHLPLPLRRTGALTEKLLYQPGDPAGVYAIEPAAGKLVWSCDRAQQFLAEQDRTVHLFEPGQAIHQIDTGTGQIIRSMACPEAKLGIANTRDTTLYVADPRGRLMCIRPKDVPYLRRSRFESALTASGEPKAPTSRQATTGPAGATRPAGLPTEDSFRSRSTLPPAVDASPRAVE